MTDAKTPRISISAPKPRRSDKGEPPQSAADTVVVGNNTRTASETVDINFKIPAELRKAFRLFCATHEVSQVSAFKEALTDYMKKKGWTPGE
ncbi:hypothetical protein [Azotobacter beijerinckii]|uniref:ParG protein n=1 Tax=Azotobacter beijerinckii TaxID=170623 RepID=A0A1I1B813_9GAMM|nr:hypothetical protein [Azotobacter beijerinckii]SFB46197.1 hypothetical protein SAMN04244571_02982 [Azotobacter beijerinckii]